MPEHGLVLSESLAKLLDVRIGDIVRLTPLEKRRVEREVTITGLVESYLGLTAYMNLDALDRLFGRGDQISGANLDLDASQQPAFFAALKSNPALGLIGFRSVALERFRETMAQSILVMIGVLVAMAGIIAFGVVYNFARISLSEQGREMASLRVLGFRRSEVAFLLLAEIGLVTLLAQPIGWVFGYTLAAAMVRSFSSEIFTMPLVLRPDVFIYSSVVVVAASVASSFLVWRRIEHLDLIAVLKTRE